MTAMRTSRPLALSRVLALSVAITLGAPPAWSEDGAAGPAWLRAPLGRGPVAGTWTHDGEHAWWGIDTALPLSFGPARERAKAEGRPALGLGLSIAGRGTPHTRDLSYTALFDRRGREAGTWCGLSSGGIDAQTRLHVATGLWRSIASFEVESGLASSVVEHHARVADHWGYAPDSLHWRDTTTFRNVDRSGLWTTAHCALRWRHGRLELTTIGGLTAGEGAPLERWAQVAVHLQASRNLLLLAAFGDRPSAMLAFDPAARSHTMVGAQVALWPSREWAMSRSIVLRAREWRTHRVHNGRTLVRVKCTDASLVEITGDFTDWTPLALVATGGGWWRSSVTIPPGLHQVQIRIDGGEWHAPPGLPRVNGAFAGVAGALLVD